MCSTVLKFTDDTKLVARVYSSQAVNTLRRDLFLFFFVFRVDTSLENLENPGNLTVVREKLGKVGKVRENVFCLWCVTTIAMVTE